ncbi:F-actin-capping protein subunit alpha [Carpediemonas membranifera]|uniref:F-actin-capping protein subunit alpha n=1 Tax=Carpediemonas membranifera TaxID=201153 RepID=A0A8J6E4C1_9EUKA|nr:F-actin-capping protein subunit alpha [Carpediemonas membranifera]|eukprot:KAG9394267.1 F-actin-capping protein subunit alpha [Carpediemonas membranifera]
MEQRARTLIMLAPPTEVESVVKDIRQLAGSEISSVLPEICKEYNEKHCVAFAHEDKQVVISEYASVGENEYICPREGLIVKVDHMSHKVTDARPLEEDDDAEYVELADEVYKMAKESYPAAAVAVYNLEDKKVIVVSSDKISAKNFYTGSLRNVYIVANGAVSGSMVGVIHFYEGGNVQGEVDKTMPETPAPTPTEVVRAIRRFEETSISTVGSALTDINENQFKALRRALPITRQTIDWPKIAHDHVATQLGSMAM